LSARDTPDYHVLEIHQRHGDVFEGDKTTQVIMLRDDAMQACNNYAWMLNEGEANPNRQGLARELGRLVRSTASWWMARQTYDCPTNRCLHERV